MAVDETCTFEPICHVNTFNKDNMDLRQQDMRQVPAMQLMQYYLKTDITDDAFTRKNWQT